MAGADQAQELPDLSLETYAGSWIIRPSLHVTLEDAGQFSGLGESVMIRSASEDDLKEGVRQVRESLLGLTETSLPPATLIVQPFIDGPGGIVHAPSSFVDRRVKAAVAWHLNGPSAVAQSRSGVEEVAVLESTPLQLLGAALSVERTLTTFSVGCLAELVVAASTLAAALGGPVEVEWVLDTSGNLTIVQLQRVLDDRPAH